MPDPVGPVINIRLEVGATHFTWRVPVKGGSFQWNSDSLIKKFGNKFVYDKMWKLTGESRTVPGNVRLEIIDILQK